MYFQFHGVQEFRAVAIEFPAYQLHALGLYCFLEYISSI
jgi:hypothetical protein